MIKGNQVIIPTPFNEQGEIDERSLNNLIDHVLHLGTEGVIALGTTGEFYALTNSEKKRVIDIASERLKGRASLTVGASHSGTDVAAELAAYASEKGADAVLVTPPYYGQVTTEGMIQHFATIGHKGNINLMIYDGGGGVEVPVSVIAEVRQLTTRMRYLKLTTPKPSKVREIHDAFDREVGVLAGEDLLIMPELIEGAIGLTTAAGNLRADVLTRIFQLVQEKKFQEAQVLHDRHIAPQAIVTGSIRNEFIQCFKFALKEMGVIACDKVRLPLTPLSEARKQNLKQMLVNQQLIASAEGSLV